VKLDGVAHERDLVGLALALGAEDLGKLTTAERVLARGASRVPPSAVARARRLIARGEDPLGEAFSAVRAPAERRKQGATYTPPAIVDAMVEWAAREGRPQRVVDPGAGSARFLVASGRRFRSARLVAVELDPMAALLARAHLVASGMADRSYVLVGDFRQAALREHDSTTLFVGNPPYVRHHLLGSRWKAWLTRTAERMGHQASQLAGLHVHFFLATVDQGAPGDYGAYITAAEWLDVNYGELVRRLFLNGLGGTALFVLEPTVAAFPDAQTTAAITTFKLGGRPASIRLRRVAAIDELRPLEGGRLIRRERLDVAARWTPLIRATRKVPEGFVELGELCRVRRGQVTGANDFWIYGDHANGLPSEVLYASVTRARELYAAGRFLTDASHLRRVIDLPEDLDRIDATYRRHVEKFLKAARAAGVHRGYIASHRKAWWSVGLYEPAPIIATYMARRPPNFVRNMADARHINIAHGIYPREAMSAPLLDALAEYLATSTKVTDGRTYAGGLTKFEPKEMERLLVPDPSVLSARAAVVATA
jgi:adenine-specific DNA-methyltransferase